MSRPRRSLSTAAVAVLATAAVAAGCGGGSDDADPTVAWADDACSTIASWQDEMASIVDSLTSAGISRDAFGEAADQAEAATETAVDDLRDLGKPPIDAGDTAEEAIGSLSDELEQEVGAIRDAVAGVEGLGDVPGAVSTVSASLSAMGSAVSSTVDALRGDNAVAELRDAFADAESCDELTG